jgi:hypothetical protein
MPELNMFESILAGFVCVSLVFFLLPMEIIQYRVSHGKAPAIIQNFPRHPYSADSIAYTILKINSFIEFLKQDLCLTLVIDQDDINNLYLSKMFTDPLQPGSHYYFEIIENRIVDRQLLWPWPFESYVYYEHSRDYILDEYGVLFERMKNLTKFIFTDEDLLISLSSSFILMLIFSQGECMSSHYNAYLRIIDTSEYKSLIARVSSITIEDNCLIIQHFPEESKITHIALATSPPLL